MASTSQIVAIPDGHGPSYTRPPFFMVPIIHIGEIKLRYSWIMKESIYGILLKKVGVLQ